MRYNSNEKMKVKTLLGQIMHSKNCSRVNMDLMSNCHLSLRKVKLESLSLFLSFFASHTQTRAHTHTHTHTHTHANNKSDSVNLVPSFEL